MLQPRHPLHCSFFHLTMVDYFWLPPGGIWVLTFFYIYVGKGQVYSKHIDLSQSSICWLKKEILKYQYPWQFHMDILQIYTDIIQHMVLMASSSSNEESKTAMVPTKDWSYILIGLWGGCAKGFLVKEKWGKNKIKFNLMKQCFFCIPPPPKKWCKESIQKPP